jgi:hypothetical protein
MTVTIWNTNTNAIATRREITGWTTPEGDASPEPIYSDPVPLERLTAAIWTRPRWNATMRADPSSYGANNFSAGERILTVIDVRPTLGEYDRLGAMGAGVADLDAGTMTYTWAKISAASFDSATHHAPVWTGGAWADPVAKSLALLKAEKTAAITARRWEVETGGITLNGAAIATDARHAGQAVGRPATRPGRRHPHPRLEGRQRLDQPERGWCDRDCRRCRPARPGVLQPGEGAARRRDRRRDDRRPCAGRPAGRHHRRRRRLAGLT